MPFFLNLGKFESFLKKRLKALSQSRQACFATFELTSDNQEYSGSFLSSVIYFPKSYPLINGDFPFSLDCK